MKSLSTLLGAVLATSLAAQSPLTTTFTGNNGNAAGTQVYFDLQVTTQITLRGLEVHLNNAAGAAGTIQMYVTNTGITTYFGSQQNAANWHLAASGPVTSIGFLGVPSGVCFTTPLTLNAGNYGVAVRYVGVQPFYTNGNGSSVPGSGTNQTYTRTEAVLKAGEAQLTPFVSTPFAPRVFDGSLLYYIGGDAGLGCSAAPAKNDGFASEGCYRHRGSFWDVYLPGATAATACQAVSTALTGKAIKFLPNGGAYTVIPSTTAFVTPVSPTNLTGFLPNNDDGELSVTLTTPFPGPNGNIAALNVHTNGIISDGPIDASLGGAAASWNPTLAKLLNAPVLGWYHYHDFNVTEVGSGQIQFHEDATTSYFTWNNVENYPDTAGSGSNRSTIQFQFNRVNGEVDLVWSSIAVVGIGNDVSDIHLIGYSPAGASLAHPETNLATFTSVFLETQDTFPATIAVNGRAVLGSNLTYTLSNVPAPVPPNPVGLGILFFSLADLGPAFPPPAGLDLGIIGAAGCPLNVDINIAPLTVALLPPVSPSFNFFVPLDLTLVGTPWHVQAVYFDAASNAFGAITSNYIKQDVGTF